MKNQVRNEIFRQMSLTLTLPLDVPVRPMDVKGLNTRSRHWFFIHLLLGTLMFWAHEIQDR